MGIKNDVDYQTIAVSKLVSGFKELIVAGKPGATMIFKAPTGSGKTVMMAMMLEKIKEEELPFDIVYLWASMGDLAHQSYEKLAHSYLPDSEYNMFELENISDSAIPSNSILFCNWEKMFKTKKTTDDDGNMIEIFDNHYVKLGESGRNLQNVLELTRRDNKKIVLIVDEAHHTYLGENSQKLVNKVIKPDMTIEISATPIIKLPDGYYEENVGRYIQVPLKDVIDSGLIKKKTIINNNIGGVVDRNTADTAVLAAALKQREILACKYKAAGRTINPLVLIQLPSNEVATSQADETMLEMVEKYMETQGVTYDNGKLAVWMSGNYYPSDVKTATIPNDSDIEVLIFKQAIATGWDCPRASILVMLRDIQSVVFEIQTVGRIIRMPELIHYADDDMNFAYVFTNINDMALSENDDAKAFFNFFQSSRISGFHDEFVWPNVYRKRIVGQRHRLNQNFRKIILPLLNEKFKIEDKDSSVERQQKIGNLLKTDAAELEICILSDIAFTQLDEIDKTLFDDDNHRISIKADSAYIERTFNYFLKAAVSPFAPHDSSRILKSVIYKWFSDGGLDDEGEVQRIIACSKDNQNILFEIITQAKQEFEKTLDKETELTMNSFSIPLTQEFGEGYEKHNSPKHVLQPYYRPKAVWDTERTFESAIEASNDVEWWFRNGVSEPKYLGIKYRYEDNGQQYESLFYPDYIVKFTDGTVGIFDTKAGDTLDPSTLKGQHVDKKANALQDYLRYYDKIAIEYGKQGIIVTTQKGLWGGIVNVKNNSFYLQSDALTQSMAYDMLCGNKVSVPTVEYDKDKWTPWIL